MQCIPQYASQCTIQTINSNNFFTPEESMKKEFYMQVGVVSYKQTMDYYHVLQINLHCHHYQ
jgi:hypothetical protein